MLGNRPRSSSDEMDLGTIVHGMLLGSGPSICVIDAPDWRTKAAQTAREEAKAAGQLPVLRHKHEAIVATVDAIRGSLWRQFGIDFSVPELAKEVTVSWLHDGTLCRAKIDALKAPLSPLILELKTCSSAKPEDLSGHIVKMGYDIQAAAYVDAVESVWPETAGRVGFAWVFCELEAPYCVTPIEPDAELLELGRRRWERAVTTWQRCLATQVWPGYVTGVETIGAPKWALYAEMGT